MLEYTSSATETMVRESIHSLTNTLSDEQLQPGINRVSYLSVYLSVSFHCLHSETKSGFWA